MASKRISVWSVLARLGHRGDRDDICQRVFEAASEVIDLAEVFESLREWPRSESPASRRRVRKQALAIVVSRLASEGRLDCISVAPTTDAITGTGTQAPNDEDAVSWIGSQTAAAMLRRVDRNPVGWSRCVKRNTPLRVIIRWSSEVCPDVPEEMLAALAHDLRRVPWVDEDGHILGSVMLRALEAELEAGRDEKRWMLVVSDFHAAIDALRGVLERLSLL